MTTPLIPDLLTAMARSSGQAPNDALRSVLVAAGVSVPSRQKISDMLCGRRAVPAEIEQAVRRQYHLQAIKRRLEEAWERYQSVCFWFMTRAAVLDCGNIDLTIEALRKGNLSSLRFSETLRREVEGAAASGP